MKYILFVLIYTVIYCIIRPIIRKIYQNERGAYKNNGKS